MPEAIHLVGLSGSLRAGSHNTALLRCAASLLPADVTFALLDISDFPLFDEDVEAKGLPDSVHRVREQIRAAEAMLIATPEYNFSVPGPLKNALDWISRPIAAPVLQGKPVAIMGAGGRLGTARAQYHLREICLGLDMRVLARPEIFVMRAWEQFDHERRLTDAAIGVSIKALLEALVREAQLKR